MLQAQAYAGKRAFAARERVLFWLPRSWRCVCPGTGGRKAARQAALSGCTGLPGPGCGVACAVQDLWSRRNRGFYPRNGQDSNTTWLSWMFTRAFLRHKNGRFPLFGTSGQPEGRTGVQPRTKTTLRPERDGTWHDPQTQAWGDLLWNLHMHMFQILQYPEAARVYAALFPGRGSFARQAGR